MAKKRASLLNAFNAAMPKPVVPPRVVPIEPPRSAEPRSEARADHALPVRPAPPAPAPAVLRRPGTHAELPAPPPPFARSRMLLLSIVGATVLLIVLIVIKFGTKPGEGNEALASAPNSAGTPNAGSPPVESAPANDQKPTLDKAVGLTDEDKAFNDTRNKFTVRVVQYANDAAGLKLARETYKYLRSDGVPAVQPIQSGDGRHIYLCADAKPKQVDLAGLCVYIKGLRGLDRKSMPFSDAYVDNIEHLIQR